MTAVEIILLVAGIVCIIVSFIFNFNDKEHENDQITAELTEEQREKIRGQIEDLVSEELVNLNEKTEASLDKISNTKILELNEYAENVLGQINRNHNETVFLYDMLNEKAKEVKSTVRDVNIAKQQVEQIKQTKILEAVGYAENTKAASEIKSQTKISSAKAEGMEVKDAARERLTELVRKSNEKSRRAGSSKENQAGALDHMVAQESKAAVQVDAAAEKKSKANEKKENVVPTENVSNLETEEGTVEDHKPVEKKRTTASRTKAAKVTEKSTDNAIENSAQETMVAAAKKTLAKKTTATKKTAAIKKSTDIEETAATEEPEMTSEKVNADMSETTADAEVKKTTKRTTRKSGTNTARARKTKEVPEVPETQAIAEEAASMNIQFEKGANNNDKILKLYSMGISNKDIAKQLNLGVGEVKLVIDLYNGGK